MALQISLNLKDDTAGGIRIANIEGRVLMAICFPRVAITSVYRSIPELSKTGVYLLLGDTKALRPKVYFGEGDDVIGRIKQHTKKPEKDFWETTVAFVLSNDHLNKGHTMYIEARLIALALETNSWEITNGTTPDRSQLLSSREREIADAYIKEIRLLLGVLGYPRVVTPATTTTTNLPVFLLKGGQYNATCHIDAVAGRVIIKRGSLARRKLVPSCPPGSTNLREAMTRSGGFAVQGASLLLRQDLTVNSISAAAAFITGTSINGRLAWKHAVSGENYASWENSIK